MRGARLLIPDVQSVDGIIPAYAGSTHHPTRACSRGGDHPRVCGEHEDLWHKVIQPAGSSPHMRGARPATALDPVPWGIIPAYAGSTPTRWPSTKCSRDHPRVCGEHPGPGPAQQPGRGSSPRMRGALDRGIPGIGIPGIIPAYAGSTIIPRKEYYREWDHPRVCGEHRFYAHGAKRVKGSSPRMRGARSKNMSVKDVDGIIPAYAGSTHSCSFCKARNRDHPRVCGEHEGQPPECDLHPGSSPRMRGARPSLIHGAEPTRIIPAYAGSTHPSRAD